MLAEQSTKHSIRTSLFILNMFKLLLTVVILWFIKTELVMAAGLKPINSRVTVVKPSKPSHGVTRPGVDGFIYGGLTATVGQFPYMVYIDISSVSFCGGSLIGDEWVLTAAHCAFRYTNFNLILGVVVITSPTRVVESSTNKFVHEDYNETTITNDVALIKLNNRVTLGGNIDKIRLPPRTETSLYVGVVAVVSGWGRTKTNNNNLPVTLQYTHLTVVPNTNCSSIFGSIIVDSTLCASSESATITCFGDSGGPLVIPAASVNDDPVQVGVVSFAATKANDNKCEVKKPTGYARLTKFTNWIFDKSGISY